MGNPDATANAIKELTKEIKKQNKLLENLTEAVKNSNNYISIPQTYDPYMRDPITNPPYTFTCKATSTTGNPPLQLDGINVSNMLKESYNER